MTQANIFTSFLDDDEEMHDIIREVMYNHGIPNDRYAITHDINVFLSKVHSSDINLYVIDHLLSSGETGLDIVKKVKAINKNSYIIVITGQSNYKVVARYLREGADDYVDKNEPNYLDDMVQAIMRGFDQAMERIKELKEKEDFMQEMLNNAKERQALLNRLNLCK